MEDIPVKAIVMGVSIFVTMAVFSAIVMYFNTAKGVADIVNKRIDIADSYDSIMNEDVFEDELTGVEVRSLIIKYAGATNVKINISGLGTNINNSSSWFVSGTKIIKESRLDKINPIDRYKVNKVENRETITLNIQ